MHDYLIRLRSEFSLDRENSWIFGVCAGLAGRCRLDAAVVRVLVVIAALFWPKITIAAYLVAWLFLDDKTPLTRPAKERTRDYTEQK